MRVLFYYIFCGRRYFVACKRYNARLNDSKDICVKCQVVRIGTIRTGVVDDPFPTFVLRFGNRHLTLDDRRIQCILDYDVQRYSWIASIPIRRKFVIATVTLDPFDVKFQGGPGLRTRHHACQVHVSFVEGISMHRHITFRYYE